MQYRDFQGEHTDEDHNVLEEGRSQDRMYNSRKRVRGISVAVVRPGNKESPEKAKNLVKTPKRTFAELK